METMDDFKDELEASFRQIREGDIITGTVIATKLLGIWQNIYHHFNLVH